MDQPRTEKQLALERLGIALPHILFGLQQAAQSGTAAIKIASQNPDGSGQMILTLAEPMQFIQDIAMVCDIPLELTPEQTKVCKARQFLNKLGIRSKTRKD